MAFNYANLTTAILNYTEVDTSVLTATITNQFIENSELEFYERLILTLIEMLN